MWTDKVDRTADIFRYVNFMLPYTTPNVLDRPILERIAKIGIGPGKPWNLAEMKPEIRLAIEDGVADALKLIDQTIPNVRDAAKLYLSRENMQTDYLNRTMGVVIGKLFTEMVFQPMLELLNYLRANGFKTFSVHGRMISNPKAISARPIASNFLEVPACECFG